MSLADKYKIPEASLKKMISDGILPCSIVKADEIVCFYNQQISSGIPKPEAMKNTSEQYDIALSYTYRLVNKFG